jgi:hypothetical protein
MPFFFIRLFPSPFVGEGGRRSDEGCFFKVRQLKNIPHPPLRADLSHKGRGEKFKKVDELY